MISPISISNTLEFQAFLVPGFPGDLRWKRQCWAKGHGGNPAKNHHIVTYPNIMWFNCIFKDKNLMTGDSEKYISIYIHLYLHNYNIIWVILGMEHGIGFTKKLELQQSYII